MEIVQKISKAIHAPVTDDEGKLIINNNNILLGNIETQEYFYTPLSEEVVSELEINCLSSFASENEEADEELKESKMWSKANTLYLIQTYKKYEKQFSSGIKKKIWAKVGAECNHLHKDINAEKCETKWKTLKRTYNNIKIHNNTSGKEKKYWEYFDIIHDILFSKPETEAIATCSSMSGLHVRGETKTEEPKEEKEDNKTEQKETHESDCFRLTNMTTPAVQDPRSEMRLHCSFDMGGEELYAVKWYKDDHEFFRYTPSGEEMVTFPVTGVHVDSEGSMCNRNSCDLLLKNIKRPESSGAYRCEVSTEAPAFRLASETHTVTVAALPDKPPVIEGLQPIYSLGETLVATCISDNGDPKPTLTFHLKGEQVPKKFIREININSLYPDAHHKINLRKSKIQIQMLLEKKNIGKYINSPTELSCVSTIEGISLSTAPPLSTIRSFSVVDHNQVVNNQKFRWADPTSSTIAISVSLALLFLLYISVMINYLRMQ